MRFDGSDVSSLGVITFGSFVGLVATGAMIARLDDARDVQVIEVPVLRTDPTARELLGARGSLRLRPSFRTNVDIRNGPVIFIDGVRLGVSTQPGAVIGDLDPDEVESVTVLEAGAGGRPDAEIHIELKPR